MKKYQIGKHIITADSPIKAVVIAKILDKKAIKITDEACVCSTLESLIAEEKASSDAYNIAIQNLIGKVEQNVIDVLTLAMHEENKHIENLYSAINGTIEAKNLEDSIKDTLPLDEIEGQLIRAQADAQAKRWRDVAGRCSDIIAAIQKFVK